MNKDDDDAEVRTGWDYLWFVIVCIGILSFVLEC